MSNLSYQKNFSYFAPAKINLCLKIGKKRQDGYHELASVVGFTEFGDAINIQLSDLDELILSGRFSADIETKSSDNLVMKSLNALRNLNHYIPPLKITIDKQIPVGGGLGGGSSDAATVFLALNKIFNLNISKENLTKIALKIGSDVPVCLNRSFMLMGGIGEKIFPLSAPNIPKYIVLTNPGFISGTKKVFDEFDKNILETKVENISETLDVEQLLYNGNDLEPFAINIYPEIKKLLYTMNKLYPKKNSFGSAAVRMSGSGSSCFSLFEDKFSANLFNQKIQDAGYWSVSTKFITEF